MQIGRYYDNFTEKLRKAVQKHRFLLKPYCVLAALYLVGICGILRANFYYRDDMGRALEGYHDWASLYRYIPEGLSTILHTDTRLRDIAPLTQILAALILALASVLVLQILKERTKNISWIHCIAVLPLGLSPYFLECYAYRYDAPYMALSVLFAILPFCFAGTLSFLIASAAFTLAVCLTYQTSLSIFPMLATFTAFLAWNQKEEGKAVLKRLALSIAGYGIGLGIFKLILIIPKDGYVPVTTPPLSKLPGTAAVNFAAYVRQILNDFTTVWLVIAAVILAHFILTAVLVSKRKKAAAFLLALVTLGAAFLFSFGIYPFLEQAQYKPRCMYGAGVFLAFAAVIAVSAKRVPAAKGFAAALSWCFFVFAFIYGNALYCQAEYTDHRARSVIQDLSDLEEQLDDNNRYVQFTGSIGYAPVVHRSIKKMPILKRLVSVSLEEGNERWNSFGFFRFYGIRRINYSNNDLTGMNLPVMKDSMYQTIRSDGTNILVELK